MGKKDNYSVFMEIMTRRKVMTLPEISSEVGVTAQTIRAYMKKSHTISSFNKNSIYYVLPSTPQFNENGVWKFEEACFSNAGTMKQTFINLITQSPAGLNSKELGDRLLINADPVINIYRHLDDVRRETIGGRYIYFSANDEEYAKQKSARVALEEMTVQRSKVSNEEGIAVLVEKIKNPSIEPMEIVGVLKGNGVNITEQDIDEFLERNSLCNSTEFGHVKMLDKLRKASADSIKPEVLFPEVPVVTFDPRNEDPNLSGKFNKSSQKTIYSLHLGPFIARSITIVTDDGNITSRELQSIAPPNCNYAYDVIETIGRLRFCENMQAPEIKSQLATQNIPISVSGVEDQAKRYIVYLSILHSEGSSKISQVMARNGGYILHIDALGAPNGGDRLITGIDSITEIVLNNAKIGSENSDAIVPFLQAIKERHGDPLRVVQDMGKGIMKAVEQVFSETPILICHYHFLRDIGKDLLSSNYDIIRKRLTHFGFLVKLREVKDQIKAIMNEESIDVFHSKIMEPSQINQNESVENPHMMMMTMLYALLEWILSWTSESNGYGFPFDRPKYDLSQRMFKAWTVLSEMSEDVISTDSILSKRYIRIKTIIREVVEDCDLKEAMKNIDMEIVTFDRLRDAMRIAPKDGADGLNDNNDSEDNETIKSLVAEFSSKTKDRVDFSTTSRMKSFFDQLEKYWEKLFADPITVTVGDDEKIVTPQRTNNIMERFFREFSRASKRKSGADNVGRLIQGMMTNTPLVKNFSDEKYLKIILDGKPLVQAFSEVDNDLVMEMLKEARVNSDKIDLKMEKCIEYDFLLEKISFIAENLKSNQDLGQ